MSTNGLSDEGIPSSCGVCRNESRDCSLLCFLLDWSMRATTLEPKRGGGNIAAAKLVVGLIAKVNLLTYGFIIIISPILAASFSATA